MRAAALLLLAPMLFADSRQEHRTEPLKAGSVLVVSTSNSPIRVEGWDKEEVSLDAEIQEKEKDGVKIEVTRAQDRLEIKAVFAHGGMGWSFFGKSESCAFTLKVPRRLEGHYRTSNARIEASHLSGTQELTTSNAKLILEDIQGNVEARTSNATLQARGITGDLHGSTSNGTLQLEQVSGGVEFSTSNGSIHAKDLDGQGKGIRLSTSNGSITLGLGNAKGEVDAATSNGSVKVERSGTELVEMHSHSARVKVAGSSQVIRLRTSNGSITIQ
jgi:DUF4097 and DUF4098 domain-containing protein YvlB